MELLICSNRNLQKHQLDHLAILSKSQAKIMQVIFEKREKYYNKSPLGWSYNGSDSLQNQNGVQVQEQSLPNSQSGFQMEGLDQQDKMEME